MNSGTIFSSTTPDHMRAALHETIFSIVSFNLPVLYNNELIRAEACPVWSVKSDKSSVFCSSCVKQKLQFYNNIFNKKLGDLD